MSGQEKLSTPYRGSHGDKHALALVVGRHRLERVLGLDELLQGHTKGRVLVGQELDLLLKVLLDRLQLRERQ